MEGGGYRLLETKLKQLVLLGHITSFIFFSLDNLRHSSDEQFLTPQDCLLLGKA